MVKSINFMESAIESAKYYASTPVDVCFRKEEGANGKITVTIKGPAVGVCTGLCELISEVVKKSPDKYVQKALLDMLYEDTMRELGLSEE